MYFGILTSSCQGGPRHGDDLCADDQVQAIFDLGREARRGLRGDEARQGDARYQRLQQHFSFGDKRASRKVSEFLPSRESKDPWSLTEARLNSP